MKIIRPDGVSGEKWASTGGSNFDDISLGLGDIKDLHENLNLDRPPLVTK